MRENYEEFIEWLFHAEGYKSNVAGDDGGRTIWGISEVYWPNDVKTMVDMKPEDSKKYAEAIYKKGYWDKTGADYLPKGVDVVAVDNAINPGRSYRKDTAHLSCPGCRWREMLLFKLSYYLKKVDEEDDDRQFLRGWVRRVINLWQLARAM